MTDRVELFSDTMISPEEPVAFCIDTPSEPFLYDRSTSCRTRLAVSHAVSPAAQKLNLASMVGGVGVGEGVGLLGLPCAAAIRGNANKDSVITRIRKLFIFRILLSKSFSLLPSGDS